MRGDKQESTIWSILLLCFGVGMPKAKKRVKFSGKIGQFQINERSVSKSIRFQYKFLAFLERILEHQLSCDQLLCDQKGCYSWFCVMFCFWERDYREGNL